jgi:hypothetical protein
VRQIPVFDPQTSYSFRSDLGIEFCFGGLKKPIFYEKMKKIAEFHEGKEEKIKRKHSTLILIKNVLNY